MPVCRETALYHKLHLLYVKLPNHWTYFGAFNLNSCIKHADLGFPSYSAKPTHSQAVTAMLFRMRMTIAMPKGDVEERHIGAGERGYPLGSGNPILGFQLSPYLLLNAQDLQ